ncbi:DUF397 domain-containing protein [Actinopolyspora mortivallis]|uniref:DUF397 domain-containing protein n=1 Tax=Actinopolyspora mortivallis TaxID=33906 RepID=A0A2T0GRG1_ACTMO|nr:DUF397 domain-containing protein [Actinopolyspora mortivallis]PRW61698.1 DUF397 domain-containing protein [Actinopolyspora mortivallis]
MTTVELSQARWRKSTRSNGGGQCLEVGYASETVGIRDTKDHSAGHIATTRQQWAAFLDAIKTDRFE